MRTTSQPANQTTDVAGRPSGGSLTEISSIKARIVYDSRSLPTLEVEVFVGDEFGRGGSPSGAQEARGVSDFRPNFSLMEQACEAVQMRLGPTLVGRDVTDQTASDNLLRDFRLSMIREGAGWERFTWAVSVAIARAAALVLKKEPYEHLAGVAGRNLGLVPILPVPMMNVINGGTVGDPSLAFKATL